jgi:D-inositol-3-phosphate glycosyltransferase
MKVALLTGGKDPHYALALLRQLLAQGVHVAYVGGDELASYNVKSNGLLEPHNLVGSLNPGHGTAAKACRVLRYYYRLALFALRTDATLFHILWFRKFRAIERTLLNAYFKLLGKRLVFTAHNVDDRARDGKTPTIPDRVSLTMLYRIVDHILVHTGLMKRTLVEQFRVPEWKVTVVPYGINDVVSPSNVTRSAAKKLRGFTPDEKILLFFGNIAPYKGLEDLVAALAALVQDDDRVTLLIAGAPKDRGCESYWRSIERLIDHLAVSGHVRKEIKYVADDEIGDIFRASDVLVLPYRRIDQSGVLALSYAQGVPVVVADVGSLKEYVVEWETGLVYESGNVRDLVAKLRAFFASEMYVDIEGRSRKVEAYALDRFSWMSNAELTREVYNRLLAEDR